VIILVELVRCMSPSQQYFSHFSFFLDGGIIYICMCGGEKLQSFFIQKKRLIEMC
jgi:hypothetical protein